ncbi:Rossmann-fold NAD(P)-binding domain-containing protein [Flavobacterium urocaniciphilum]|uniref:Nucleoside-diphosphate-sugar epimerase n=1 Tax=Flavobacterium urocaniciphilum TaxID=1299341 RepID=A0A1H9E399_9FLAO|nr:NAD(P)-dependent oxidoreductase [Flavobacterium urocaniciphilum]SEQ20117.1 Nucleoside-diphosphate-sugar epimerase [Flavobacterium urocaniciphilum]
MKISILGCGWLGLPLAKKLIEIGFEVKGSTTSENKLVILKTFSIEPFLIELTEEKIIGNISGFLNESKILIIDIPPGLRKDSGSSLGMTFVNKIKNVLPYIENSTIEKVIFISSTSVYGDAVTIPLISEESDLHPDTESGRQLIEVENIFRNNRNFETIILRFGGLIGNDRNPIKFLAGKTNVANPKAPINFIHQDDCIGIISEMINQYFDKLSMTDSHNTIWNETYNAVAPNHPTRAAYYTQKAIDFNLPKPEFNETEPSIGKIISSEKIEKILGYTFKVIV